MYRERTKYMDAKHHFVHDIISQGVVDVKVSTHDNPTNVMTKAIPLTKFRRRCPLLHLVELA
ncbi:retrotransposon protein, putative, Ty1-copia subclass [Senna tora]|uniref:Retrotransposon protein, putative, Ty1-copia subclass n=1 Tax=Senna tora TaxID=362788 RepID=A0A834XBI5_9FABA|nr:retrotransposon protein, putative, Ty1-copia subclass [Senna tora]